MPQPVVVIPFASSIHGKEYYMGVLDLFKRLLEKYAIEIHSEVITEEGLVPRIAKEYSDYFPIILILTGGTSKLVRRFIDIGAFERTILLAHGEHNSLSSAISARAKLEADGIWTWLYYCTDPSDRECSLVIDKMMKVARTVTKIIGSRIIIIGISEKNETIENYETKFNSTVSLVSMDDFEKLIESADRTEVEAFIKEITRLLKSEIPLDKLVQVGKIYAAIKKLSKETNADAIAIDCFPYLVKHGITPCLAIAKLNSEGIIVACEADIQSVFNMLISKSLSGTSGWIANANIFEGRRGIFSHCTISLDLIKNGIIVSHFESGYPYSLSAEMNMNVVTLLSISSDFSLIASSIGKIVQSGMMSVAMCRTQAVVEFNFDSEKIPLVAPANHHVFIPGDHREELKAIAYLLGIDYSDYYELISMV